MKIYIQSSTSFRESSFLKQLESYCDRLLPSQYIFHLNLDENEIEFTNLISRAELFPVISAFIRDNGYIQSRVNSLYIDLADVIMWKIKTADGTYNLALDDTTSDGKCYLYLL